MDDDWGYPYDETETTTSVTWVSLSHIACRRHCHEIEEEPRSVLDQGSVYGSNAWMPSSVKKMVSAIGRGQKETQPSEARMHQMAVKGTMYMYILLCMYTMYSMYQYV